MIYRPCAGGMYGNVLLGYSTFAIMKFLSTVFSLASLSGLAHSANETFQSRCANLPSQLQLDNTTVYFSQYVAGGQSISLTDTNVTCLNGPSNQTPVVADVCRVAAYSATSERSGINFEVWLPANWSGRFISHGNGGMSGCIDYSNLAYSTSYGFAAVSAVGTLTKNK